MGVCFRMMLSILICTRQRVSSLDRLLRSIVDNAHDMNNIEVIIGYDYDDEETIQFINTLENLPNLNYKTFEFDGNGSYYCGNCKEFYLNRHKDILHPMTLMSSGDYLWGVGDDTEIKSKNFDIVMKEYIEYFLKDKPNRILYAQAMETNRYKTQGITYCTETNMNFACFPIITRESFEILGFMVPLEISGPSADITLARIYHQSLANRFLIIPEINLFDHIEPVSSSNQHHCNLYTDQCLFRDIEKIDRVIMKDGVEHEALGNASIKIKIALKCKLCNNQLFVSSQLKTKILNCNICNTRNVIADKYISLSQNLLWLEKDLSDPIWSSVSSSRPSNQPDPLPQTT